MALPSHTRLGKTGWNASHVGFGGYRLQENSDAHRIALREALLEGCNVIDTSANYGDGGSERLIGRVLKELRDENRLKRDQVFVVSKAGYVQGRNLELAQERARAGRPFPEMVEYSPDCWHCLSPEFLEDQLTRTLERLGLAQLDALLLHNPEYFLKSGGEPAEYYRRIEAAFAHLEKEADRGRIRFYGVSSNTFPEPRDSAHYTSLETVHELALKHGPGNRFALIQFPFNLYEPGAALETNNASGKLSVVEYARKHALGTLVNRPLNSFARGKLVRLADFTDHSQRDIVGEFKTTMNRATALEAAYPGRDRVPARQIAWGHIIRENFEKLADLDTWKSFLAFRIEPSLDDAFRKLEGDSACQTWCEEYRDASARMFRAITNYLESQASVKSDKIAGMLDHLCPELASSPTLSQKVIRLYRSLPGMDCILVGMRQTRYVQDTLKANLQPPVDADSARRALIEADRIEF